MFLAVVWQALRRVELMDCGGEVEVRTWYGKEDGGGGGGGGRPMIPSSSWSCPRLVGDGKTTVELRKV